MCLSRFEWLSATNERHVLRIFMYMYLYLAQQQPVCEFTFIHVSLRGTTHNKVFLAALRAAMRWYLNWSLVVLWNFSIFDFDFTKNQHYHLDCQQLNTTTNHIHYPKSYTLELVSWMCRLWDTTVKKKSEILKCHQYRGFLFFFFLWIYMWRQQIIIIYILIHNRVWGVMEGFKMSIFIGRLFFTW